MTISVFELFDNRLNSWTIPPNSSVTFDAGDLIQVAQYNSGQSSILGGFGVTLRGALLATRAQYSVIILWQRAINECYVFGYTS